MTVDQLLAKHDVPNDRYATHRAAEVEMWNGWYRSGPSADKRNEMFAMMAVAVADRYHGTKDEDGGGSK